MAKARLAVLGAGRMGCGIAQVFCAAGNPVSLYDVAPGVRAKAPETIRGHCRLL